MAHSSPCLRVLLLLLLAVAHAVEAAEGPATMDATAEAPGYDQEIVPQNYELLAPAAGAGAGAGAINVPRAAAGCVKTVLETSPPCARDVLLTLVFGTVHLSEGCCAVLAGVGEKCVVDVFSAVPQLGPALLPVVSRVCGLVASIV